MDPSPNAAIIAVGAVVFTREEVIDQGEWILAPHLSPGSRSLSTFRWWNEQDPNVKARMWSGDLSPWDFAKSFSSFVGLHGVQLVWGDPARFDLGHLRQLYRAVEQPCPWSYKQERDLMTLEYTLKDSISWGSSLGVEWEATKAGRVQHSALSDALTQARQIGLLLKLLHSDGGAPRD